jgi:hypothetical protein
VLKLLVADNVARTCEARRNDTIRSAPDFSVLGVETKNMGSRLMEKLGFPQTNLSELMLFQY